MHSGVEVRHAGQHKGAGYCHFPMMLTIVGLMLQHGNDVTTLHYDGAAGRWRCSTRAGP